MSKESKFLSIAIGLLQGKCAEEGRSDEVIQSMDADRMCRYIEYVKANIMDRDHRRTNEVDYAARNDRNRFHQNGIVDRNAPLGNLMVETVCGGKGTPAQVKLFKLLEDEDPDNFNRVNGKITMIRDITGFNGCLSRKLPVGRYVVEISKGSECEIIKDYLEIEADKFVTKKYELIRFINMEEQGWMAGELHHHSIYSSPVYGGDDDVVETPEEISNSMMAMGLAYGALSDHHNVLNHEAWRAGKRRNFVPIISKEISTSNGHVMAMGVHKDVIYAIPEAKDRTDEYLRSEFVRITDEIKENGGLAQINHPRDLQKAISWNPDFEDMLDIFETMEIWNGSNPMMAGSTNDAAFKLWLRCLKRDLFLPATTGSDTHNICADDYHVLFDDIMDTMDAIKAHEKELKDKYPDETLVCEKICSDILPVLEKWAETCLTSGCVRTYVFFDSAEPREATHTQENILKSLRRGNSFLTNGPILVTKVNGKIPGKRVTITNPEKGLDIDIQLLSNRRLKKLKLCTENGVIKEVTLKGGKRDKHYDYSCSLKETVPDANYLFFMAEDDCTNLAITNPVILARG